MARVKVCLDRRKKSEGEVLVFDELKIDVLGRVVTINDERLPLTPKEIDLLIYMATNRNIALSREKLLYAVWNYDYYGDDRTVDTHIKMLRHNLGSKYRDYIVTVRGMGYKFEVKS